MKLKTIILLAFLSFWIQKTRAQEPEYETVFSKNAMKKFSKFKFYGTVGAHFSPLYIDQKFRLFSNVDTEGGLSYLNKMNVGINYKSFGDLGSSPRRGYVPPSDVYTYLDEFSLALTFTPKPRKTWHMMYKVNIGSIAVSEVDINDNIDYKFKIEKSLSVLPSVGLETNLLPWLTIRSSLGYRVVSPKNSLGLLYDKDFSGPWTNIGLKLGNIR
jgi:hypothetical protein